MRVLVVDPIGQALDFCLRCQAHGHAVRWYVPNTRGEETTIGDGMVRKIKTDEWYATALRWADLVFATDNTTFVGDMDALRARGRVVCAASAAGATLELDRSAGQAFLKACGISILPAQEFTSYEKAEAFVRRTGRRYASKPNAEDDKSLSYLARTPADMVFMLQRWRTTGRLKGSFVLQEFVKGVEVAVGGWITPKGFVGPWLENFEHKKLMAGDKGQNTGEMGTVARYSERSVLADKLLKPCEDRLAAMDMTTYVDVSAIMDASGVLWPLEFTVRPGWPTFNLQTALLAGADPAEFLAGLCEARLATPPSGQICTGVLMAIPPFPNSKKLGKDVQGFPMQEKKPLGEMAPKGVFDFHPVEVKMAVAPVMEDDEVVEREVPSSAGDYIGIATGLGDTVAQSRKRAYAVLENIDMPSSPFWRDDIGERLTKDLPALQAQGYCKDWKL